MPTYKRSRTIPDTCLDTLPVVMELATLVDKGEITGLAYIAHRKTGGHIMNIVGSLARHGQIQHTREMIEALYAETEHIHIPDPQVVTSNR